MQVESIARPLPPQPPPSIIDRKYNVVFYGIKESPADTSKSDQLKHDLDGILTILSDFDTTLILHQLQLRITTGLENINRLLPTLAPF